MKLVDRSPDTAAAPHARPAPRRPPSLHDRLGNRGVLQLVRSALRGGRPLDGATRAYFEPRLGRDLSGVRIHDDGAAAASARALRARAYTVGADVVFGAGQYDPASAGGRERLGHELAHVAQQAGAPAGPLALGGRGDPAEREADRAGRAVADGGSAGAIARSSSAGVIRRQDEGGGGEEEETHGTLNCGISQGQPGCWFTTNVLTGEDLGAGVQCDPHLQHCELRGANDEGMVDPNEGREAEGGGAAPRRPRGVHFPTCTELLRGEGCREGEPDYLTPLEYDRRARAQRAVDYPWPILSPRDYQQYLEVMGCVAPPHRERDRGEVHIPPTTALFPTHEWVLDGFATFSADLTDGHRAQIPGIVAMLQAMLARDPGATIQVIGHGDPRDRVRRDHNLRLGMDRAFSVTLALTEGGALPFAHVVPSTAGDLERMPGAVGDDDPRERRVVIRFVPSPRARLHL